jgi:hypothetical protein
VTSLTAPTWDFRGSSDSTRCIIRTHRPQFAPKESYLDRPSVDHQTRSAERTSAIEHSDKNDHFALLTAPPTPLNLQIRRAADLDKQRAVVIFGGRDNPACVWNLDALPCS